VRIKLPLFSRSGNRAGTREQFTLLGENAKGFPLLWGFEIRTEQPIGKTKRKRFLSTGGNVQVEGSSIDTCWMEGIMMFRTGCIQRCFGDINHGIGEVLCIVEG